MSTGVGKTKPANDSGILEIKRLTNAWLNEALRIYRDLQALVATKRLEGSFEDPFLRMALNKYAWLYIKVAVSGLWSDKANQVRDISQVDLSVLPKIDAWGQVKSDGIAPVADLLQWTQARLEHAIAERKVVESQKSNRRLFGKIQNRYAHLLKQEAFVIEPLVNDLRKMKGM